MTLEEVDAARPPQVEAVPLARLLVTAHFVRAGAVGGAEHMLYNLLQGMVGQQVDLTVAYSSHSNLNLEALAALRRQGNCRLVETGGPASRFLAEQRAVLRPDLGGDAVLFPNYFVPPLVPARLGRVVAVLHDLQYRHFPQYFSAKKRIWLRAAHALAARRADRIVVLSEFARQDALRWLGAGVERKLAVIPNPISWDRFGDAERSEPPLDYPYVLSVAAQYPHKNLETLLRAFAVVAAHNRELRLVLCGQGARALRGVGGGTTDLAVLAQTLGIRSRLVLTGYLDDAALGRWYRHARVFAFPSLFEGFGMPPVEALGFGLPVLTTRVAAIPETTSGLAHYVQDPRSVPEWVALLSAAIHDPDAFCPTRVASAALRSHYSPRRIARQYLALCVGGEDGGSFG
jgi:glycosyltransferase involved in cell wall biosynthesis